MSLRLKLSGSPDNAVPHPYFDKLTLCLPWVSLLFFACLQVFFLVHLKIWVWLFFRIFLLWHSTWGECPLFCTRKLSVVSPMSPWDKVANLLVHSRENTLQLLALCAVLLLPFLWHNTVLITPFWHVYSLFFLVLFKSWCMRVRFVHLLL